MEINTFAALIRNGETLNIERFHTICGDGYVDELVMGGVFQSAIQVHTASRAETEKLAASLNASFSIASGTASFSSELKKLSTTNKIDIWTYQRGGSGPMPISADELSKKASGLLDNVIASPTPIQAAIFSYVTILDDPKLPLPDFAEREAAISFLSDKYRAARDQQADAQYIIDHPAEFYSTPEDLPLLAAELQNLINVRIVIESKADACIKETVQCSNINFVWPNPVARPARR